MSTTYLERRAGGFAIVSAIFILVVLAALAGFIVSVTSTQNITFAQDVQGARAYQAARAGTEYGMARWLASSSTTTCPDTTLGDTPTDVAGTPSLAAYNGFTVTVRTAYREDGGVKFCIIEAIAITGGSLGSLGYIERQLRVAVEGS